VGKPSKLDTHESFYIEKNEQSLYIANGYKETL